MTTTSNKITSTLKVETWDHDPGVTAAVITSPDGGTTLRVVNMARVTDFAAVAMTTIPAAGALTLLEIIASAAAAMTSPEVIKTSGAVLADAVGDTVVLECSAEEVAQIASSTDKRFQYVAARLTMSNAGAEAVVTYISMGQFAVNGLTPSTTIA